jgi:hypothetical protein
MRQWPAYDQADKHHPMNGFHTTSELQPCTPKLLRSIEATITKVFTGQTANVNTHGR